MDMQELLITVGLGLIASIIGGYIQYHLNKKGETETKKQIFNEDKYRSILLFMRLYLNPSLWSVLDIPQKPEEFKGGVILLTETIKSYALTQIKEFYHLLILSASDDVLTEIKKFIEKPTEDNFMSAAMTMRKDLWEIGTQLDFDDLTIKKRK